MWSLKQRKSWHDNERVIGISFIVLAPCDGPVLGPLSSLHDNHFIQCLVQSFLLLVRINNLLLSWLDSLVIVITISYTPPSPRYTYATKHHNRQQTDGVRFLLQQTVSVLVLVEEREEMEDLLKVDMMNLDQDFFCRWSEFRETNAIQRIVEQEHLISATRGMRYGDDQRRRKGWLLGDLSHPHGELFVGHGVDPVNCVIDWFSFSIFIMLLILLLDVLGKTLDGKQKTKWVMGNGKVAPQQLIVQLAPLHRWQYQHHQRVGYRSELSMALLFTKRWEAIGVRSGDHTECLREL